MTIKPQNDNLNYLKDPTFTKVNRLFALSFVRNAEGNHRDSFSHYYVPNVDTYATGNLLDLAYFKGNYRLIAIDLSK